MNNALQLEQIKQQIAQYCAFSLGQEIVTHNEPIFKSLELQTRLQRSREAIDCVVRFSTMPFSGVYDIREYVEASKKDVVLSPIELMKCALLMRASKRMLGYFKECSVEKPALDELLASLMIDLSISEAIERCISHNYEILDNASSELKGIRKSLLAVENELNSTLARFIQNNASKLTDTITTTRNDRSCVLVKISEKNTIKGFIHGESASGATAYVEPECLILINNKRSALISAEQEEIERILFECSQMVKAHSNALLSNCETLGVLDSLNAIAEYAIKIKGCVAQCDTTTSEVYLKNARHPLIDEKKVVSNTYRLKNKKILLITGSNTGGKTVTLKTIGLFMEMTLCGFPLPADEAILPMIDAIFVDIGDEQSIEQSLSTFSAHLSKLTRICQLATSQSFVILDELGSGTDPKEGEALAIAILDELRKKKCYVFASTHYSKLKLIGAKWEEVLCSSVEFDIHKMQPTYRYIEGLSGQSNAFEIARRFGLSEAILSEAMRLKEANESENEKLSTRLDALIEANITKQKEVEELRQQLTIETERFNEAKIQFENEKDKLVEEAKLEAYEIVENAKEESQSIIDELKSKGDSKYHELLEVKQKLNTLVEEDATDESQDVFKVGDYVLIKQYNYFGDVLEVRPKDITVLANGLKMKLKASELRHATRTVNRKQDVSISKRIQSSFSMECNVIGERVVDALAIVDKYLDGALVSKVTSVRLVHGVGTGALRIAIWDYLKKNKYVDSFRIGGEGEGGSGATVVTLKNKGSK